MLATTTEMLPTTQNMNSSYSIERPHKNYIKMPPFVTARDIEIFFFIFHMFPVTQQQEVRQENGYWNHLTYQVMGQA
jgi:hypothetical protein